MVSVSGRIGLSAGGGIRKAVGSNQLIVGDRKLVFPLTDPSVFGSPFRPFTVNVGPIRQLYTAEVSFPEQASAVGFSRDSACLRLYDKLHGSDEKLVYKLSQDGESYQLSFGGSTLRNVDYETVLQWLNDFYTTEKMTRLGVRILDGEVMISDDSSTATVFYDDGESKWVTSKMSEDES